VVWAGEGNGHTVLERFYDELGEERLARLEAVSLDMGGAYKKATDTKAGHVRQCVDPFYGDLRVMPRSGLSGLVVGPRAVLRLA
jgi:transposase